MEAYAPQLVSRAALRSSGATLPPPQSSKSAELPVGSGWRRGWRRPAPASARASCWSGVAACAPQSADQNPRCSNSGAGRLPPPPPLSPNRSPSQAQSRPPISPHQGRAHRLLRPRLRWAHRQWCQRSLYRPVRRRRHPADPPDPPDRRDGCMALSQLAMPKRTRCNLPALLMMVATAAPQPCGARRAPRGPRAPPNKSRPRSVTSSKSGAMPPKAVWEGIIELAGWPEATCIFICSMVLECYMCTCTVHVHVHADVLTPGTCDDSISISHVCDCKIVRFYCYATGQYLPK